MTSIYHDPTESRSGSRLPQSIIDQSHALPGLEHLTGGDLLIAIDNPPDDVRDMVSDDWCHDINSLIWRGFGPTQIARDAEKPLPFVLKVLKFRQACQTGLLVQRKTGRDLSSSVPRLSEILFKMLAWTSRPWLLFIGDLKCGSNGNAIIDGYDTNFSHNAVQGALESWQLRGGYYTTLSRDTLVAPWCGRWLDKLSRLKDDKAIDRQIVQPMVGPTDDVARRLTVLSSLKHVGKEKAKRLLDHYGTLAGALEAILDPMFPFREDKPKGFGATTTVENRQLFGLTEDWMRLIVEVQTDDQGTETRIGNDDHRNDCERCGSPAIRYGSGLAATY